jgi:glycosyltransferase involved in cell wall biosynthesis
MTRWIAFDLTRLFIGPMFPVPRGIDRVDLAYARHFFEEWNGTCVGVLPTPWGIRWFNRDRSLRVSNFIEDYWRETGDAQSDPAYAWVKAHLRGEQGPTSPAKARSAAARLISGFLGFARQHGLAIGHPISSLPTGTVYLNTGQTTIAVPQFLTWLGSRRDITPVFMLHDVIPIEYPEYCSQRLSRSHGQMLASTTRYAKGLIVTTEAAGQSIRRELTRLGRNEIPIIAVPLPVPAPFLKPTAPDPELSDITYYVVSGAIEPRKNHLLLLNVWRELVGADGSKSPKLVLVGSRLRTTGAVIDMLEKCSTIRDYVVEVDGLSSPGLRQLLAGARALLMPSFAEGFGIPIIEALAVGTPVIASDLPAHQEAGGTYATYLSPMDGPGWLAAIRNGAKNDLHVRSVRARSYRPRTWSEYFERVDLFIAETRGLALPQSGGAPREVDPNDRT